VIKGIDQIFYLRTAFCHDDYFNYLSDKTATVAAAAAVKYFWATDISNKKIFSNSENNQKNAMSNYPNVLIASQNFI